MDRQAQLYSEETLHELKELRKDLTRSGSAELIKNIEKIKGDKGDDGVSIKSISSELLEDKALITVTKTDGEAHSFEVERIKGIDGQDGADGEAGKAATIEIAEVSEGASAQVVNVGNETEAKLKFVIPKAERGRNGKDGKNGKPGKDGTSFVWRKTWTTNTSYQPYDVVEYMGSSFICVKPTKGRVPTAASSDWDLVAQKGKDGRDGVNGSNSTISSITRTITTITTDTTAASSDQTDYVYFINADTTLTMPSALNNSNRYTIKNIHTTSITVASTSGQTFDGGALILNPDEAVDLVSDGANWRIV